MGIGSPSLSLYQRSSESRTAQTIAAIRLATGEFEKKYNVGFANSLRLRLMGHSLTVFAIYLSLLCYLLGVVCWVSGQRGRRYRILWTTGCVALLVHAAFAFHFYHGWSHADAVELTAEQTASIIGVRFGEGIWFSYLLMLIWAVDVSILWSSSAAETSGTGCFSQFVHGYAFFILFNGTVVFEDGWIRWAGIVGTLWIIRLSWRFRKRVPRAEGQV